MRRGGTIREHLPEPKAHDVLDGGEWVQVGMRKVWRSADATRAPETPAPTSYPKRVGYDVAQLRVCMTCPATLNQPCLNRAGKRRPSGPHAGRLVSRRCACGDALSTPFAHSCVACAFEQWAGVA